eukprot:COSAG01_NODE_5445_length_4259_cov_154.076923_2_plen_64_part_00
MTHPSRKIVSKTQGSSSFTSLARSARLHKENKRVWLPESVGFDVRDCTDLQNRGFSDDPDLGQ